MIRSMKITSLKGNSISHLASPIPNQLFLNLPEQVMLKNLCGKFTQNQPGITFCS